MCGGLRPFMGKKRESDVEKEKKKEERYNQLYALEKERCNQSYSLEKERLELEKRRVEAEESRAVNEAKNLEIKARELQHTRMLDEERIMTKDTTALPLPQQQYYKVLQDEILARCVPN